MVSPITMIGSFRPLRVTAQAASRGRYERAGHCATPTMRRSHARRSFGCTSCRRPSLRDVGTNRQQAECAGDCFASFAKAIPPRVPWAAVAQSLPGQVGCGFRARCGTTDQPNMTLTTEPCYALFRTEHPCASRSLGRSTSINPAKTRPQERSRGNNEATSGHTVAFAPSRPNGPGPPTNRSWPSSRRRPVVRRR